MMAARGFTLIEMMVVVAILGILMAIAGPAFNEMIAGQRVKDAAFEIHASMLLARSEALKRNASIHIAPVGGNWQAGWSIANPAYAGTFISQRATLSAQVAVSHCHMATSDGGLTYNNLGRLDTAVHTAPPTVSISATNTGVVRCVQVDLSGRPAVGTTSCSSCI